MKRSIIAGFVWGLAIQVSPIQAAEPTKPLSLAPSSDWVLDYAEDRCAMTRRFGTGDNTLYFRILTYSSFSGFRYVVFGKPIPPQKAFTGKLKYGFRGDSPRHLSAESVAGRIGDFSSISFGATIQPDWDRSLLDFRGLSSDDIRARMLRLNSEAEAFEKQVDSIQVEFDGGTTLDLHVGNMGKPMEALRGCQDDLMRHWGLDPEVQRHLSRSATPSQSDATKVHVLFPANMVGRVAFVPVRVAVDPQGNALSCTVQDPAVERAFATAVCAELGKKFVPALNAAGEPVASVFQDNIMYQAHG